MKDNTKNINNIHKINKIDYTRARKSLNNLTEQYKHLQNEDTSALPPHLIEALKESVIQRFEISYEIMWKSIKKYLTYELGISDTPSSPKPIFRIAYENKVLNKIEDIYVRDTASKELLEKCGVKKDVKISIDPVFGVKKPQETYWIPDGYKNVGIYLRMWNNAEDIADVVVDGCRKLLKLGYNVYLVEKIYLGIYIKNA